MVNLNAKILLDSFGYISFYLFAILETFLFFSLFLFKCFKFIYDFQEIKSNKNGLFKILYIIFNSIIIFIIGLCLKLIKNFFFEAFNTLTKKE